jgi:uncharacterized membrane protein
MKPMTDKRVEHIVGRTLHWGVIISGAFMLTGFAIYAVHSLTGAPDAGWTSEAFRALLRPIQPAMMLRHPLTYLYAGMLILVCTPIWRVVTLVVLFALERDWRYVWISTLVLSIIALSIVVALW